METVNWQGRLYDKGSQLSLQKQQIEQQIEQLNQQLQNINSQISQLGKVQKGKANISDLIGNEVGPNVYSGLNMNEAYPVKLEEKGKWGSAIWSGDRQLYYYDDKGNLIQQAPATIIDPTGDGMAPIYDNTETRAQDVKRGANALIKADAKSKSRNPIRRSTSQWLLNTRSNANSSNSRLVNI